MSWFVVCRKTSIQACDVSRDTESYLTDHQVTLVFLMSDFGNKLQNSTNTIHYDENSVPRFQVY